MATLQPTFIDCKKLDLEERKCQEIKRSARGRKYWWDEKKLYELW